ncbi:MULTISPECIES: RNA-binding domain-containing protein [Parabacteroides]|uniref:RNA-binding domain-containing protein n=1 Tax=Parabacteroides leei TaxID=2939491 RepID=UPI00189A7D20|nr:RNA-binding domain-containing protein [Parabacteroides goldsteinii]
MTFEQLTILLESLLNLPTENEVVEFKRAGNGFDTLKLGAYFSALSNEANLKRRDNAWLVFGINDKDHAIVGTNYKSTPQSLCHIKREIAEGINEGITFNDIFELIYEGKRVLLFQIPPAPQGIPISYKGHYYGRDGESLVALNISEIESIRNQVKRIDWSAQIIEDATIEDLDATAIQLARSLYISKNRDKEEEILTWDNVSFLNKAKITIKGRITNTAILLLGKEESEYLISPATAKIRWILKDHQGIEKDYLIKGCPMIISVEEIYRKIRNLKYRYINPEFQTLFPEEIDTYEPYIIREALNNAIAHQDYSLGGQITVVEYDDKLVFANKGCFIPRSIQNVLINDAPEEVYRNQFLAQAMVNLKMVDTIGSGIRKMFFYQRQRLFPLPDYNFDDNKVQVSIIGKILNIGYASILAQNTSLSLSEIEILNRVQLNKFISDEELNYLRKKKLIEGRKPNIYLARSVAQKIDQKIEYSNNKGFDDSYYCDLIIKALSEHKVLTKQEITKLLIKKLPDILTIKQKHSKIQNLLTKLRKSGKIENESRGIHSNWRIV